MTRSQHVSGVSQRVRCCWAPRSQSRCWFCRRRPGAPRAGRRTGRIPRADNSVGPAAGGRSQAPRSSRRRAGGARQGARRLQGRPAEPARWRSRQRRVAQSPDERLPIPPEPTEGVKLGQAPGRRAPQHQPPHWRNDCEYDVGPRSRVRCGQQRPDRDHAGSLQGTGRVSSRRTTRSARRACSSGRQRRLTPSYEYQVTCPNDQNLIFVQGRAVVGDPLGPAELQSARDPGAGARPLRAMQPPIEGPGRSPRT